MMSRLTEATELREVLEAAHDGLLDQKRSIVDQRLADRDEVLA
jgi:hypothetical protein